MDLEQLMVLIIINLIGNLPHERVQKADGSLITAVLLCAAWESADLPVALPDSWYKHYNDRSRSSPPTVY